MKRKKCPHCGKVININEKGDEGNEGHVWAVLLFIGLAIGWGIAYAQGWVP